MSSPDRASSKRAPAGAKSPKAAAAPKTAARAAPTAARKQGAQDEPSSQEKADFVRAMSKGIAPNTAAARKVDAKKTGSTAGAKPAAKTSGAKAKAPAAGKRAEPEAPKVEVLRRIPAPEKVIDTPASAEALRIAAMIEKKLADGELDALQPHAQQALIAALCKLYAANSEAGQRYPILGQRSAVTATDVMIMCGALLKAVDLQVFELGMWQSWSTG